MASIRLRPKVNGEVMYCVLWREEGRQRNFAFRDLPSAERYRKHIEMFGAVEARRILDLDDDERSGITLTQWLNQHIDSLTGVQPGTLKRYQGFVRNDIEPSIGHLPLKAVTDATIGRWVQGMTGAGKTIQNKHGFLSGALAAAVKAGRIPSNPCEGRRLPETEKTEMVFLSRDDFYLLREHIPHDRWKNLATWLVSTGMRFNEATALQAQDVDLDAGTCRIHRAWKFTGAFETTLGPPKSRRSNRTINLPPQALEVYRDQVKLGHDFLFANGVGSPVRTQEFFNLGWRPGRDRAAEAGLKKKPRVHDLRHTCASWMIAAGVPLPVLQAHLGHESITTTIGTYGHLDRTSHAAAADAIARALA